MTKRPIDDLCARPDPPLPLPAQPLASPLYTTSVWRCADIEQADRLLGGEMEGYVYQRDAHPNADLLMARCGELHGAERGAVAPSGMGALALAFLSQLRPGDRVLVSHQMYGRTHRLLLEEGGHWGINTSLFDPTSESSCAEAFSEPARMVVVETISNPNLRVVDLPQLAERCQRWGARLLVDNTFATPLLCAPLECGASLVMESLTKMMNGHSDVILGYLGGTEACWDRVPFCQSTWGLIGSPWDCWLAARGLATMHLRVDRACENALRAAEFLASQALVERVEYPGLSSHPDHELARQLFGGRFGTIITFHLRGGREEAQAFLDRAGSIPLAPSLGEISTTISHPVTTSHRGRSREEQQRLGIGPGTLRLSCGVESPEGLLECLAAACGGSRS
jgi:cystathionine beta-lyase/cystathionine gamma-synthase